MFGVLVSWNEVWKEKGDGGEGETDRQTDTDTDTLRQFDFELEIFYLQGPWFSQTRHTNSPC